MEYILMQRQKQMDMADQVSFLTEFRVGMETWGGRENAMVFPGYVEAREFRDNRLFSRVGVSIVPKEGELALTAAEKEVEVRAILEKTRQMDWIFDELCRELDDIGARSASCRMRQVQEDLQDWRQLLHPEI